jgi:hypothetical protein
MSLDGTDITPPWMSAILKKNIVLFDDNKSSCRTAPRLPQLPDLLVTNKKN